MLRERYHRWSRGRDQGYPSKDKPSMSLHQLVREIGEDNLQGAGRMDVKAAVNALVRAGHAERGDGPDEWRYTPRLSISQQRELDMQRSRPSGRDGIPAAR